LVSDGHCLNFLYDSNKSSLTMLLLSASVITSFFFAIVNANNETETSRIGKQLGVFTVVQFPNDVCLSATSGRNGTCYTSSECSSKGGSSSGSCASSFGVCCVFEKSCGAGSISENCTYFSSSDFSAGSACSLTICKTASDVCNLRLDFETFVLSNPVTDVTGTGGTENGLTLNNRVGNCDTDFFTITNPGGESPPIICGTNTGQHMFVDAADQCNVLSASFGSASTASSSAFTIKVTQIECSSKRLPPDGCLQYFTAPESAATGTISSFNYNSGNGVLLANQEYAICIRGERTYCSICYWQTAAISFGLSYPNDNAAINEDNAVDTVCGHGEVDTVLTSVFGAAGSYDHIMIPDGRCEVTAGGIVAGIYVTADRYCGTNLGCYATNGVNAVATPGAINPGTVCTNSKPFKISVFTDGKEWANGAASETIAPRNVGFEINYFMKTDCVSKGVA